MEEVRHTREVSVGGLLVGYQLGVGEGVADYISEEEDGS